MHRRQAQAVGCSATATEVPAHCVPCLDTLEDGRTLISTWTCAEIAVSCRWLPVSDFRPEGK